MGIPKLRLDRDFSVEPIVERLVNNKKLRQYTISNKKLSKNTIKIAKKKHLTLEEAVTAEIRKESSWYLSKMIGSENLELNDILRNPVKKYLNGFFTKINIDEESVKKVLEAQKQGSLVFLPPHWSLLDYVSESWFFDHYGIKQPYIAAGSNIWFLKIGFVDWCIRSYRGFPIDRKRTTKKDYLYLTTIKEFTKEFLEKGFNFLLYLDGGRRKEGKPRNPKGGELKALVEYQTDNPQKKIFIVPTPVVYERIPEDCNLVKEVSTGLKKYTTSHMIHPVFLPFPNGKCGELYIKFNKPFLLDKYLNSKENKDKSLSVQTRELSKKVIGEIENTKKITSIQLVAADISSVNGVTIQKQYLIEKRGKEAVNRAGHFFKLNGAIKEYTKSGILWWDIKKEKLIEFYKNQIINKYRTQDL